MYTGHIAQCKLHCKNCTTTVAHICSINKMGRLHRMLILKACPYQQILSSKGTETTNGTASQHHPYQQICWSTRWVNRPDCSFWPPFDISCHPETTKWVARPIWNQLTVVGGTEKKNLTDHSSYGMYFFNKSIHKEWTEQQCDSGKNLLDHMEHLKH